VVYPTIAVLALLLAAAAACAAYLVHMSDAVMIPLFAACAGTIAYFLCTAKAAPNMLSLRNAPNDEGFLARQLDGFATWHAYRVLFQFLTFAALVWALEAIRGREIVAYYRGPYCVLAFEAVATLREKGFKVRRLEEGFPEWKAAGLPVVTGTAAEM
jgi:rhodanese-related sulfurtransferase